MDLKEKLKLYRLNEEEYELIKKALGRPPEGVEWALFSALWSEHCSYKTSKVHLKKFYSEHSRVLQSFGENAGVIDLGEGERIAFKMESHNHPSYIEPYEGAATGVGGILRDIFTMGARPIALADYLCFGMPQAERMAYLVDGVVRGIGGYGNCVGVPTLSGQTEFHSSYNGNILVNAFALGLFRPGEPIATSGAKGPGNFVVYVGAKTGRDGVHGASMASESFDEDAESKKPTVQIGDPFFEKLLIESCLEVIQQDLVVAIQDMGAAGIVSSSFEMAAKGGVGLSLHLDKVPLRDQSVGPEEILLSESQERMLLICEPHQFEKIKSVFSRWDLDADVIGEVKKDSKIDIFWRGEQLTSIDPMILTEEAPRYNRPYEKWQAKNKKHQPLRLEIADANQFLLKCLSDIRGCSRKWVTRQYDQGVGAMTAQDTAEPVAVLSLPDSGRSLGMVLGCRPYVMRTDCELGAQDSAAYPALELAVRGFKPLAVTDCLNFGNPERPAVMGELVASIENLSQMCEALQTPVISGNVSLYNETGQENVTSTPAVGLVGLRDNADCLSRASFVEPDQQVFLVRMDMAQILGQSQEVIDSTLGFKGSLQPKEFAKWVDQWIEFEKKFRFPTVRVVGKFGRSYTLARMCIEESIGFKGKLGAYSDSWSDSLSAAFGENFYEVYLTLPDQRAQEFQEQGAKAGWQIEQVGVTGGDHLKIQDIIDSPLAPLKEAYEQGWRRNFESLA